MNENDTTDEPTTAAMSKTEWMAKADQARAEERRLRALGLAVRFASSPNWSGSCGHVIGIAKVFEEYIQTGKKPTKHQLNQIQKEHR